MRTTMVGPAVFRINKLYAYSTAPIPTPIEFGFLLSLGHVTTHTRARSLDASARIIALYTSVRSYCPLDFWYTNLEKTSGENKINNTRAIYNKSGEGKR